MTANASLITYQGYKITVTDHGADVFDPRFKKAPPIYRSSSVAYAKNWIDAYRDGAQWAVDAAEINGLDALQCHNP